MFASTPIAPSLVIKEQCTGCSKWHNPHELIRQSGNVKTCFDCYAWHCKALDLLCGKGSPSCQECNKTSDQLEKESADGNVRVTVHRKDGVYQMLCNKCSDAYEQKRRDLYGNTPYGAAKGIGR